MDATKTSIDASNYWSSVLEVDLQKKLISYSPPECIICKENERRVEGKEKYKTEREREKMMKRKEAGSVFKWLCKLDWQSELVEAIFLSKKE